MKTDGERFWRLFWVEFGEVQLKYSYVYVNVFHAN